MPASVVVHDYHLTMHPAKLRLLERNRGAMVLSNLSALSLVALAPLLALTEAMMWGYCLVRGPGFLRAKLSSYGWILRHLDRIRERRRQVRSLRRRSDRQVLRRPALGLPLGPVPAPRARARARGAPRDPAPPRGIDCPPSCWGGTPIRCWSSAPAWSRTISERILDHPRIELRLGTSFEEVRDEVRFDHLVYTGPIDAFYGHRFGSLPYRSLRFEWERVPTPGGGFAQPVAQVNEPSEEVAHTRTVEYRHLDGRRSESSTLSREYPSDEGHPFYPVPTPASRELYRRYRALAVADPDVTFVGRLARYQYLNMDQVTAQALATFARIDRAWPRGPLSRRALAPRRSRRPGRP